MDQRNESIHSEMMSYYTNYDSFIYLAEIVNAEVKPLLINLTNQPSATVIRRTHSLVEKADISSVSYDEWVEAMKNYRENLLWVVGELKNRIRVTTNSNTWTKEAIICKSMTTLRSSQ